MARVSRSSVSKKPQMNKQVAKKISSDLVALEVAVEGRHDWQVRVSFFFSTPPLLTGNRI